MLGDAFRKLGRIESVRKYAEGAPYFIGEVASGAFEEVGAALESYINAQLYGAIEVMKQRQEEFKTVLVEVIKEAIKQGVKEAIAELQKEVKKK